MRHLLRSQGTNFETKTLGGFWAPPTKASYTTPNFYPNFGVSAIQFLLWDDPFNLLYLTLSNKVHRLRFCLHLCIEYQVCDRPRSISEHEQNITLSAPCDLRSDSYGFCMQSSQDYPYLGEISPCFQRFSRFFVSQCTLRCQYSNSQVT